MILYDNAIVIGTSKLTYKCAHILKCLNVNTLVYSYNPGNMNTLEIMCKKNGIHYKPYIEKKSIENDILSIKGKKLIISAFNTYIFSNKIIDDKDTTVINYHPSLLPKHPGRNSEAWSIYEQDSVTGITWHFVDNGIDTGDIIEQKEIKLNNDITSLKLMMLQQSIGEECFINIANELIEGKINRKKQEKIQDVHIHLSGDVPNDGIMNLEWNLEKKYAFLRSLDYGRMPVFKKPKCIIGEDIYYWDSYKKSSNCVDNPTNGTFYFNGMGLELIGWRKEKSF